MKFDVLLVVGYFRSATPFLSVIRHLSGELRIGVLFIDTDASLKAKTGDAHELFVELCVQFGAEIVRLGDSVETRLMVVQQFPYEQEIVSHLRNTVRASTTVAMMTLASAGLEKHDEFIAQFGITKAYCLDAGLVRFLLERRAAVQRYRGVAMVEVGLPFRDHPVFPDFQADWLFVAPTTFSFYSEAGKKDFLLSVSKLLAQIPASDRVVYKPHNGNALDYFAPRLYYPIARMLAGAPLASKAIDAAARRLPAPLANHLDKLLSSILHVRILRRALPMNSLTRYADISVEAFLPGVRKGVVGGLSNVIWGARHFGLPFLNCVDPQIRQGTKQFKPGALLTIDLNVEYFGVPYCNGELNACMAHDARLANSKRVDLLDAMREDACSERRMQEQRAL